MTATPKTTASLAARRKLKQDLRQSLKAGDFVLHYQPVIDIRTRLPVCMEALVRWQHPERGLLSPDKFIPFAEATGMIKPLGAWVLRQASADATAWPDAMKVAVNLSPVQLETDDLAGEIASILDASGLSPRRLELEITESVLLNRTDENLAILHELRELGISIALDDFGTGYSSLSYLRTFPFDKIKIDRSFIREMPHQDSSAAIVCAVANLGRSLDIVTTAEGVETEEQFELLRAAGCTQAQGFLLGRPAPGGQLEFGGELALRETGRNESLGAKDIMLVRASFAQIAAVQELAAEIFYARLFELAPEVRALFPEDMSEQRRKMMAMLSTGVGRLHDMPRLSSTLKELGARHAGYGAKNEHYAIVGDALLWMLNRCLGDSFTPEIQAAWIKIYAALSAMMQAGAKEASSRAA